MIDILTNKLFTINNGFVNINAKCNEGLYYICIKPKKMLKCCINNTYYTLALLITYCIPVYTTFNINIKLERFFKNTIKDINDIIENINIFKYGDSINKNTKKYQILYSFDSNYFIGGFASIYSLLSNFNKNNIDQLNINLCIPENDKDLFDNELERFIELSDIKVDYTIIYTNFKLVHNAFINTKCYKGGNHLLKLSNFSRLIAGQLFDYEKLLYIDADTIVQTDLSKCLDNIKSTDYIILGKKSSLNYTNLINVNNKKHALEYLGNDFDLKKNVIYTGTMIFNTKRMRKYYDKMIELVENHNKVRNGIYKLFTMSIINISINNKIKYFDEYINNVVDLGFKKGLENIINKADVLDWSGMYKPWLQNGLYKEYWIRYNIMYNNYKFNVVCKKDTVEKFS